MTSRSQPPSRIAEIAAFLVLVAIPILLVGLSWEPLAAPPARGGRANIQVDRESAPGRDASTQKDKRKKREKKTRQAQEPASADAANPTAASE